MIRAAHDRMQGGYHTRPCKQLRQVTEADAKCHTPRFWADEQDQWCTPKWNVYFMIIAKSAGLQQYVHQGFAYAKVGDSLQDPKQPEITIQ